MLKAVFVWTVLISQSAGEALAAQILAAKLEGPVVSRGVRAPQEFFAIQYGVGAPPGVAAGSDPNPTISSA